MKHIFKTRLLIVIIPLLLASFVANAQPRKSMERLLQLKKVQLLDVLDLSQEQSEKFLSKYNADMDKLIDLHKKVREATLDLRKSVAAKESNEAIKEKTEKLEELQEDLNKAAMDRLTSMKELLTSEQYAKYLVFEESFAKELRKHRDRIKEKRRR